MPIDPETAAQIGTLQTLDDAIAFRANRLSLPCPDCIPGARCLDHLIDTDLIAAYQERHSSVFQDLLDRMDPEAAERVTQHAATAVNLLSEAVLAQLREVTADGPVVTQLDGRHVVLELDGQRIIEHPLEVERDTDS